MSEWVLLLLVLVANQNMETQDVVAVRGFENEQECLVYKQRALTSDVIFQDGFYFYILDAMCINKGVES